MRKIFLPDEDRDLDDVQNPNIYTRRQKRIKFFLLMLATITFSLIVMIVPNGMLFIGMLFLSLLPIVFITTNNRILVILASVYLLLQLIIFPLIYVALININLNSLEVNSSVKNEELKIAEEQLYKKYHPKELSNTIKAIEIEMASKNKFLWKYFLDEKFNLQDKFTGFKIETRVTEGGYKFNIMDKNGLIVKAIYSPASEAPNLDRFHNEFIFQALKDIKLELEKYLEDFKTDKLDFEQKRIWNYENILPYTINIFGLDSIKPISRISHIVYAIQSLFVNVILLGIIITFLTEKFLNRPNEMKSNNTDSQ